ncbi:hypothetical protein V8E52_008867 [Russula decolorans]
MLPFIVALVFAVGLPLLPSSLYRALNLPALKFNFLSARHAPEQVLVSSPEPTLLLERSYAKSSLDSGESLQYLAFPDVSDPDSWNDAAAAPACVSITEEQEYPQTSLWHTINAQLLYQIAEAAIIMTLSFFVAATFFPRHYLHILLERLCTTLFISRQYSPKAALSSFLQDVFSGLHRYWMENSVAKGLTPKSADNVSWLAALEVFADIAPGEYRQREASVSLVSVSFRQDLPNLVPFDEADLCLEGSFSSVSSISPLQSAKISTPTDTTCTPLLDLSAHSPNSDTDISGLEGPRNILGTIIEGHPSHPTPPTVIIETTNHDSDILNADTSSDTGISPSCLPEAPEPCSKAPLPVSSHLRSCTESFPPISMEDLYNSARRSATVAVLSEPFLGAQTTSASDPSVSPHSSCGLEAVENIAGTTPNSDFERSQSECISTSSSRISQSSRRRYKSDCIQVRAASCHLGDTATTLAPAKVDATCAFWKSVPQNGEGRVETPVKEASGLGSLPGVWAARYIEGIKPELADGSPTATDAALTGIVTTPEGTLIVPASQRPDGSLRKEIRVRPGYALREPLVEKYRPPAMRRRTSTWDPHLREYPESPLSSPHLRDSLLPSTPNGIQQRLFVPHDNSPASLSDNWRQSSSGLTVEGTSPTSLTLPSMEDKLSPVVVHGHERKLLSETPFSVISTPPMIAMASQATVAVSNLVSPIQSTDRFSFHTTTLGSSSMNVTENIKDATAKVAQASNSVGRDGRADRHPEEPSGTPCTLTDAKGAVRLPLQDITASTSVPRPKTIEYPPHPLTATETGPTPLILKQNTDASSKEVFKPPVQLSEGDSRETTSPNSPHKRKPSADPNALCVAEALQPSGTPTPHNRHPRARRSAPHLGKYTHNNNNSARQQAKAPRAAQTPDGSKRRRTRTASAKDVENWNFNVSRATPTIDRSGQIILPAGMGWKGRTFVGAVAMAGQPQLQRQRLPTGPIV